jgi:apolipoprotein N-acyltransferase
VFSLAAASGVLLVLSFPKFGHPAIAWIALAPVLLALTQPVSLLRAFWLGLLCGVVYFGGTLYWMTGVMSIYGGVNVAVAAVINTAFVVYLAIYPAIFAVLMRRLLVAYGARALAAAPLLWTTAELGRGYLFTGFPWALLGYSQASVLPIAQIASIVGVFGVSGLIVCTSAACVGIAIRRAYVPAAAVLVSIVAIGWWGSARVKDAPLTRSGEPLRVGLVQGNVDQAVKWDVSRSTAIFNEYLTLTREAIARGAALVIWPESSTPFRFEEDLQGAAQVRALAKEHHVTLLFGSDHLEWSGIGAARVPSKAYNSAFLVRPDGATGGMYSKMHLVPWGEYVPLKDWLFFVGPLVEAIGTGFVAGEEPTLLPVDGHRVSVAICYEVIYPDLVRRFVRNGSELLTTITNDAWFGRTSAPYQHFEQASMRAIEEGRYMVRAANTGVSGIVDPYGRVLERSDIYQPAVIVGDVRLVTADTVYARAGDVFAYVSAVVTLILVAAAARASGPRSRSRRAAV